MDDSPDPDCLFCRIITEEIPSERLFADDAVIVVRDVAPRAPFHVLAMPRRHVPSLDALTDSPADTALLAALFSALRGVARDAGLAKGYRIVSNIGSFGGQTVPHLHLHLLGGRAMTWPPG
jgi:histidine triad (HIT) family protein